MTGQFGWCNDGKHGPSEGTAGCPGEITSFFVDERTKKAVVTGRRRCGCPCHGGADET